MSNVDKRVVQMEFDNKDFEKNVKQSTKTIEKFDEKLQFKDVSDSLTVVKRSFTSFEIAAITAITNISNKMVNFGIQLVKSLSVDNVASGWQKFGDKTVAVGTMAAQTIKVAGRTLENYEEQIAAINEQLEKLNWFTDETSYSFIDMVDTIGKFTAAGQDLDVAVNAMMGIANWAALSGQNAATASRAMYQLAQALGKGYVQLIDYKSIQNANMDTQEFRETILKTAVSLGELTKEGENFITKTGKKFTKNQFAEFLNEKWFTSDVLVKGLEKYSAAVQRIYEISTETGLTASEVMKRYAGELDKFGLKAFKAAQEARTLRDAINSIKDAVSTGWMNTAENLFGSYDESKELWTELANNLYEVFAEGGNFRNEILSIWKDLKGRADLFARDEENPEKQGAFWNIYDSIVAVKDIVKGAWETIFPRTIFSSASDQATELSRKLKLFTEQLKENTKRILDNIKNDKTYKQILEGLFNLFRIGLVILKGIRYSIEPIVILVKELLNDLATRLRITSNNLNKLEGIEDKIANASRKLYNVISKIIELINPRGVIHSVYQFLVDIKNVLTDSAFIEDIAKTFKDFFDSIKNNGKNYENFKNLSESIGKIFSSLGNIITKLVKALTRILVPVLKVLTTLLGIIVNGLSKIASGISNVIDSILNKVKNFKNKIVLTFRGIEKQLKIDTENEETEPILIFFKGIETLLLGIYAMIDPILIVTGKILSLIGNFLRYIGKSLTNIVNFFTDLNTKTISSITKAILLVGSLAALGVVIWLLVESFKAMINPIQYFTENISDAAFLIGKSERNRSITGMFVGFAAMLIGIASAISIIASIKKEDLWRSVGVIAGFSVLLMAFVLIVGKINKSNQILNSEVSLSLKSGFSKKSQKKSNSLDSLSGVLLSMGLSMILFAEACKILSNSLGNNEKAMNHAMTALVVFAGILALAMIGITALSNNSEAKEIQNAKSLRTFALGISASLLTFAKAMKILTSVASEKGFKAASIVMLSFAALISIIMAVIVGISKGGKDTSIKKVVPVIAAITISLLSSLITFVFAMKTLTGIASSKDFTKASIVMGGFIVLLSSLMTVVLALSKGTSTSTINKASGMLMALGASLSTSLIAFAIAMKTVANVDWKQMVIATGSILALIIALGVIAGIAGKNAKSSVFLLTLGASLITLAASVVVISYAIGIMAEQFKKYSDVKPGEIIKGLVSLAALLLILGVASSVAPGILAVTAALLMLGTAVLFTGIGVKLLKDNFVAFCQSVVANSEIIKQALVTLVTAFVGSLIEGIKLAVLSLSGIILEGLQSLLTLLPDILAILNQITTAVIDATISIMPKITELLVALITSVLTVIKETGPLLIETLFTLIDSLLESLNNHIVNIVNNLIDVTFKIIDTIIERLPEIVSKANDLIAKFVEQLIVGIPDLMVKIIKAVISGFKQLGEKIGEWFGGDFKEKFQGWIGNIGNWFNEKKEQFKEWGSNFMSKIQSGMEKSGQKMLAWSEKHFPKLTAFFKKHNGNWKSMGQEIIDKLKQGFSEAWDRFTNWVKGIADKFKNFFKKLFGIHSPSKDFAEYGEYMVQGLGKGILDESGVATDSLWDLGEQMNDTIGEIVNDIDENVSNDLVITPVMDLSNVDSGVNHISSLMSSISGRTLSMSTNMASDISRGSRASSKLSNGQNGSTTNYAGDNYYSTFNVTTNNPEELARQTDIILQRNSARAKLAKGGVK